MGEARRGAWCEVVPSGEKETNSPRMDNEKID